MKKIIEFIKLILISGLVLFIFFFGFFGAALQKSYELSPPSQEEIAQMGWFEWWIYEPFTK